MRDGSAGAVLDASALLAYLREEPGNEIVERELLNGAVINVVNYAEVLSRLSDIGVEPIAIDRRLKEQGLVGNVLEVLPLHEDDGVAIAQLRMPTRSLGLSLGDRACLATALRLGRPVVTADRSWAVLQVGVTVQLIRS